MTELSKLLEPIKSELGFLFSDDICSEILSKESVNDLSLPMQTLIGHLLKGGEGSGHYGHTGLPGVWGGSRATGTSEPASEQRVSEFVPVQKYRSAKSDSFVLARDTHLQKKYEAFLTPYTEAQYKEMSAKTYLSATGKSGYAIMPDGDIISVFSARGSGEGFGAALSAIARGGTKLDCFDGKLVEFYSRFGFVEYDRWPWDDQYAHPKWDYEEHNRPDVVLMRLRGEE